MIRAVIVILILSTSYTGVLAQLKYKKILNSGGEHLYIDNYDKIYILNKNEIVSFSFKNKTKRSHSASKALNFSKADVTDPFELIVYESNFNKIHIFDNRLNLVTQAKISELPEHYTEISFVRSKGALFVLPAESPDLYEYSLNYTLQYVHSDFVNIANTNLQLLEIENTIAAADKKGIIYIFQDSFQNYKKIEIQIFTNVKYIADYIQIFDKESQTLTLLKPNAKPEERIKIPLNTYANDAVFFNNKIIILNADGLYQSEEYSLKRND